MGSASKVKVKVKGWTHASLSDGAEDGRLDALGVLGEAHVAQHHHSREEESGGIGLVLSCNVWGRSCCVALPSVSLSSNLCLCLCLEVCRKGGSARLTVDLWKG